MINKKPAILLLDDGSVYHGVSAGIEGTTSGEICFNTGMTGYQEIFSDPSYFGQLLVTTNVHIGNYGIKSNESESDSAKIAGLITKNFTDEYSRPLATESIQQYCENQNLVAISDIDTRSLVKHIRTKGAMNAILSSEILDVHELKKKLKLVPNMHGQELSSKVSTEQPFTVGSKDAPIRIAVLDLGTKVNILNNFVKRGCYVKVFPAKSSYEEMSEFNPHGYFLSNGPGDPASMSYAVDTAKKVLEDQKPLFGICLGHQIIAQAVGLDTYKMHHGHRGINHPVLNLVTGKCEVTSQNHGFGVSRESIEGNSDLVEITHINLNDNTVEGLKIKNKPAFSVQYHPESSPGPHDSRYLFDDFVKLIKRYYASEN